MDSPLEIERVEWLPATPEALEVRVCGRWREGAPPDVALVVVDERGDPRRFPLTGAGATDSGSWRGSFAVPVELRSRLSARLSLAFGDRRVSLPAASPGPADERLAPPPATVVDPAVLAQRRAAREGQADEALVRRAQAAEATAATLETQLDHLEARLRSALAERDQATARLRAAEQREEAERRVRVEAEGERDAIRASVRRERERLEARARAAEEHAEALGAEMDAIRREAAEAQQAAMAARAAAERAGEARAREELDRLAAEAADLARRLEHERSARAEAESRLARQGERVADVEATVAQLERELERRTALQAELDEVRRTLADVRDRAGDDQVARAALREAQGELAVRTAELERLRADLARSQADLESARAAQRAGAAAVREAEETVALVRREAAELQSRLEEERRRRCEAEAALNVELERARERFGREVAELEAGLSARIAEERRAFEAQVAAIEALVAPLRERLAEAGAQLEARLAEAERARDEAVAERDAARAAAEDVKLEIAADLDRAADERERLTAALTEAEAERARLASALADAEAEAARLRAAVEGEAERDAALGALIADVRAAAGALREGFDRRLAELADRIDAEVAALRARLDEERVARQVAEEELAAERARGASGATGSLVADVLARAELEQTRRELAAAQEALAARHAESEEAAALREQAGRLVRDLEAAEARLKVEREDEAADPDAEAEAEPAAAAAADPAPAEDVAGPPADDPAPAQDPAPEASDPAPAAEAEPDPAPAAEAEPDPAPEAEAASKLVVPATGYGLARSGLLAPPPGSRALPARFVHPSERRLTGWLTPAIVALAERDEALAADLVVALLPGQAGLLRKPVRYALTIGGRGTYAVGVDRDRVAVSRENVPGSAEVDVRVSGSAAALAPLVGGGARRKLPGVRIEGRRRRLRPLLRARRAPTDLARLLERGAKPGPELVLAVLAAAVDPAWTRGHRFSVVYDVTDGDPIEVEVRDGQPLAVGPPPAERAEPPAARIAIRGEAVLPFLARCHLPADERILLTGEGHPVALLHGWFDRAQGLPGA